MSTKAVVNDVARLDVGALLATMNAIQDRLSELIASEPVQEPAQPASESAHSESDFSGNEKLGTYTRIVWRDSIKPAITGANMIATWADKGNGLYHWLVGAKDAQPDYLIVRPKGEGFTVYRTGKVNSAFEQTLSALPTLEHKHKEKRDYGHTAYADDPAQWAAENGFSYVGMIAENYATGKTIYRAGDHVYAKADDNAKVQYWILTDNGDMRRVRKDKIAFIKREPASEPEPVKPASEPAQLASAAAHRKIGEGYIQYVAQLTGCSLHFVEHVIYDNHIPQSAGLYQVNAISARAAMAKAHKRIAGNEADDETVSKIA